MGGIALIVAAWLVCGILTAGIYFADCQGRHLLLASRNRRADLGDAYLMGLLSGPVGLVLEVFASGFCQHGWRLR